MNSYLTRLDDSWFRKGKKGVGIAYREKCTCRAQESREADGDDGTQRAHEPDRYEDISTSNDAVKFCATVKSNRINGFAREQKNEKRCALFLFFVLAKRFKVGVLAALPRLL